MSERNQLRFYYKEYGKALRQFGRGDNAGAEDACCELVADYQTVVLGGANGDSDDEPAGDEDTEMEGVEDPELELQRLELEQVAITSPGGILPGGKDEMAAENVPLPLTPPTTSPALLGREGDEVMVEDL